MDDLIKKARRRIAGGDAHLSHDEREAFDYAQALIAADEVIAAYRSRMSFPNSARTADNLHSTTYKYRALLETSNDR